MVSLPSPLRPVLAFLTLALSLHAQVSTEWDQSKSYDRGVVVIHSEELYLAHTQVPSGVELTNISIGKNWRTMIPTPRQTTYPHPPRQREPNSLRKLLCPMV